MTIKNFTELTATEWQSVYNFTKNCIKESIDTGCASWFIYCSLDDYREGFIVDIYDDEDNRLGEGVDTISLKVIIDESFEKLFNEARDEAYEDYKAYLEEECMPIKDLIGAAYCYNSDPSIIENEEQAIDLLQSINKSSIELLEYEDTEDFKLYC